MTKKLTFLLLLTLAFLSSCGQEKEKAPPCEKLSFEGHSYDVCKIDLRKYQLNIYSKDETGKPYKNLESVKQILAKENRQPLLITNGGIYNKDLTTTGLLIENGQTVTPINKEEGKGNFYLKPNAVFLLSKDKQAQIINAQDFDENTKNLELGLQSGPALVLDDSIHPAFNKDSPNVHIRNGIGVINENQIVIAISNEKVNLWHFANLFKEKYACENALYLDGFVSEMYCPSLERDEKGGQFATMLVVE